jgi:hypothetical protein
MFYSPKHAAPTRRSLSRRAAGVAVAGASVVGGSLASATSAEASGSVWDRVAACESGGNWSINTGNGYYGGLQFSYSTWRGYGGQRYAQTANGASKGQQIEIAQKVLRAQGPGAWPVCGRRAGLTRENGLAGYTGGGDDGTTSRTKQRKKVSTGKLVVDGVRGRHTNAAIERWVGGSVNGSLSRSDWKRLERKVGGSVNGTMSRSDVRKLQRIVGTRVDGLWGPNTNRALQRYLNRVL